ncbi:hypothetical protein NQ314_005445 [Rhamnusium bicolor]|uniref:Uncharacterized protein n=1 Tax=Rhamnusium bicolor TaxID=1586634 RepID=A0AAV8ZH19_9CUCU|nr:hypothetical protein NQ314_005445 [Rhamnusium bicolor]
MEHLRVSLYFISTCISMKDITKDCVNWNLKEFENTGNTGSMNDSRNRVKCCFCTRTAGTKDFTLLNESKENMFLVNLLGKHIPELIELNTVQEFTMKPTLKYDIDGCDGMETEQQGNQILDEIMIKVETDLRDEEDLDNQEVHIKTEEVNIKHEQNNSEMFQEDTNDNAKISMFHCTKCSFSTDCEIKRRNHVLVHKASSIKPDYKCEMCTFSTARKKHFDQHRREKIWMLYIMKLSYDITKDCVSWNLEEFENTGNANLIDQVKCCFCTRAAGREDFILVNESKENMFLVNMLEKRIPELNLNSTQELLTCETCHDSLQGILSLVKTSEEAKNKYSEIEDEGQMELNTVQEFTTKGTLKYDIDGCDGMETEQLGNRIVDRFMIKDETDDLRNEKVIDDQEVHIKTEEIHIKHEHKSEM